MKLDEAIRHAEEVYKDMNNKGKFYKDPQNSIYDMGRGDDCLECAEEHRQLAEWLKDYKRLLTQPHEPVGNTDNLACLNLVNDSQGLVKDLVKGDRAVSLNEVLYILDECAYRGRIGVQGAIEDIEQLPSIDLPKWAEEHGYVIIDKDVWKDCEKDFGEEIDRIIDGMNGGDTE